jgi:hypothetical protein
VSDVLQLLHALKDEIPSSSLLQLCADDSQSNVRGPLKFALNFYGLNVQLPCNDTRTTPQLPFVTAFEDIISFSAVCATAMTTSSDHRKIFRDLLVQSLSLLNELVTTTTSEGEQNHIVDWNPSEWISHLIGTLETEVALCYIPHRPLIHPIACFEGHHVCCCRPGDDFAYLTKKIPRTAIGLVDRSTTCGVQVVAHRTLTKPSMTQLTEALGSLVVQLSAAEPFDVSCTRS